MEVKVLTTRERWIEKKPFSKARMERKKRNQNKRKREVNKTCRDRETSNPKHRHYIALY